MDNLWSDNITYFPASGSSRQIKALINYLSDQQMDGLAGGSRPTFEVTVRNDSTSGISSTELNTGGDKIELSLRYGLTPKKVRLVKILSQDKGMLRLLAW